MISPAVKLIDADDAHILPPFEGSGRPRPLLLDVIVRMRRRSGNSTK
jgi:hypothetical protein